MSKSNAEIMQMTDSQLLDYPIENCIVDFFTQEVNLPIEAQSISQGKIWWEPSDEWLLPWRIVKHTKDGATGYPCGEPQRKLKYETNDTRRSY